MSAHDLALFDLGSREEIFEITHYKGYSFVRFTVVGVFSCKRFFYYFQRFSAKTMTHMANCMNPMSLAKLW